jgi:glyoxylase-like metal-dependent hydrolase (beta-lactamase superfamily II)
MMKIKKFTFNPFQENTYVLYDESKEAIIVDPGCFNSSEEKELAEFISINELKPIKLINTHAHIDHVLGNKFVADKYKVGLELYQSEYPMLKMAKTSADLYGVPYNESPEPSSYLKEGDQIIFGKTTLEVIFVPGHAPDHLVFLNKSQQLLIGGDTLFKGSIGRTDLPGGNHDELLENIRKKLFTLDESIVVYSGHGEETTIGEEKKSNPFF